MSTAKKSTNEPIEKTGLDQFFEVVKDKVDPIKIIDRNTGKQYILEFSRQSIVDLAHEKQYSMETVDDFTIVERDVFLFEYSLRKNHPDITHEKAMQLFDLIGGLTREMLIRLDRLYYQAIASHLIVSEDDMGKNPNVEVVM